MDSKQILTSDLLDVIFDQRNKAYGAYELRRHYNRRIKRALIVTATLVGMTITSVTLANKWQPKKDQIAKIDNEVIIRQIEEEVIPPKPLPEPEPAQQQEQIKTEQFTTPRIVPEDQVTDPPPAIADLDSVRIGVKDAEGVPDTGIPTSEPSDIDGGKKIIAGPEPKNEEPIVDVQVQAKFIGNWEKFLLRNLNGNVPVDNGANPGRYQIVVQFVVDVDGSVSDIKPITNLGYGMEQEAIRVLKKATKWEPAWQNGRQVKAYRRQPITFQVDGE